MFAALVFNVGISLLVIIILLKLFRKPQKITPPCNTMVVLGSGGHTTEMLTLFHALNRQKYHPVSFIVAETDALSLEKAENIRPKVKIATVPRAREVKQSWISSILTTLKAFLHSYFIVLGNSPDLLLCNGPGTCVPLCLAIWLNNKLRISSTKIVFVESVCRVKTLSLSAVILTPFVDQILVQWPELADLTKKSNVKFIGRFV